VAEFKETSYFRKPSDFDAFMELGRIVKQLFDDPVA
jgi:hypothetical protein